MTSSNDSEKDPRPMPAPEDAAAPEAAEPAEAVRELTDEEIATVSGGDYILYDV